MNVPMSERVQRIADMFFFIAESVGHEEVVDMSEGYTPAEEDLKKKNYCGTKACHAGWFDIFTRDEVDVVKYTTEKSTFDSGVDKIYQVLDTDPESWAFRFPNLWGNTHGARMFDADVSPACFTDKQSWTLIKLNDPITLKMIADHWQKVAIRVMEAEARGERVE